MLDTTGEFRGASLLLDIPEHQAILDGGAHASQTEACDGRVSILEKPLTAAGLVRRVRETLNAADGG